MQTRREFLKRSSLIALAPSIPAFLANSVQSAQKRQSDRVLVVVQLDGGNDGLNTVIPYADENYAKNRPNISIPKQEVIRLDDQMGLHPSMRGVAELMSAHQLSILQGVGYPNPDRSHDISMEIWHTSYPEHPENHPHGWLGRALDEAPNSKTGTAFSIMMGDENSPQAIRGRKSASVAMNRLDDLLLDQPTLTTHQLTASNSPDELKSFIQRTTVDAQVAADSLREIVKSDSASSSYPDTKLARRLSSIAQLIKADFSARVYYAVQTAGGNGAYDTHIVQLPVHGELLRELSGALLAFMGDLSAAGLSDQVAVVCFSEFGRRVAENASLGTDHGTAGPVILAGGQVKHGLFGSPPNLTDLDEGDLKMTIDFRQIYATLLDQWLEIDSTVVLGRQYEHLPIFA